MTAAGWFAVSIVALLLWAAPEALFLIFGGVLLGVLLDTLSQFVRRVVPMPRTVALALVCCVLLGLAGWGIAAGGIGLLREVDDFVRVQRRTVDLPPVVTLAGLVVFGALLGAVGVAVATPLMAFGYAVAIELRRRNMSALRHGPEPFRDRER